MSDPELIEAPRLPREWFTVLFGSKAMHGNFNTAKKFTDRLYSICDEQGLLLCQRQRPIIFQEDNVDMLLSDIHKMLSWIQEGYDEPHFPFIILINDQTLVDIYEVYIEPMFKESAFIYNHKAYDVLMKLSCNSWEDVAADISMLNEIFEECNPIRRIEAPRPLDNYRSTTAAYRDRDERCETERREEYGRREETPPPARKKSLTVEVVRAALEAVKDNRSMLPGLAEDMDDNVDFAILRELPRNADDLYDMLRLFVLTSENAPENPTDKEMRLRRRIAETMLVTRLLNEMREVFLAELGSRIERAELARDSVEYATDAAELLLRAFAQLDRYDILDEQAISIWTSVESDIFHLPGRFWSLIGEERSMRLCKMAAEVTRNDVENYSSSVHEAVKAYEARKTERLRNEHQLREGYEERREAKQMDQENRQDRGDANEGTSTTRYNYDPYDMDDDDESDTTEDDDDVTRGDHAAGDGRDDRRVAEEEGRRRDDYDDWNDEYSNREEYGRRDEEYARRQQYDKEQEEREEAERRAWEEERARKEEEQREKRAIEAAEREREYEQRRHERAIQVIEGTDRRRGAREENPEELIAWTRCEGTAPPISFRRMSNKPVYDDLYKPKPPYMRRALIAGEGYDDNEHYLDVQFRLMREDMVSPLRDGLYASKMLVGPGKPIQSSMELKIYPMIELGALQVRMLDGLPMRVVQIPQHLLYMIREERQLKFGQCVVLSSDHFEREFHVGWICDRFQDNPQMPWTGRLAISFFDECMLSGGGHTRTIDKHKTYSLAESPSYLEAYRHVLNVLRKMRKHVPFPLERYLVSLKKTTRLPQYMRSKEQGPEDQAEDRERMMMYRKSKDAEEKKRAEKEKKKKSAPSGRKSRSASQESDEDDDTANTRTTEEGASTSNSPIGSDDGFNTDEEDEFLTGGKKGVHPNPKDLESISIKGKSYAVEQLEQQFQSETLDETQRKAMCYALTSELAIIQGPPGTGKTHIGVEIVMALIENRIKWRMTEPILIVTFSNQALDHFLEKIIAKIDKGDVVKHEDAPTVVRLGSRSESDLLTASHILSVVMRQFEEDLASPTNGERKKKEVNQRRRALATLMQAVKIVQTSRSSIMAFATLQGGPMDPTQGMHMRQFAHGVKDSTGNQVNMDEAFVCWLLDKSYEKKRDMPTSGEDEEEEDEWDYGARRKPVKKPAETEELNYREKKKERKKEKNERKRAEKRAGGRGAEWKEDEDSSDGEEEDDSEAYHVDGDEDGEDGDIDVLTRMLNKANLRAAKLQQSQFADEKWRSLEKYEVEEMWEAEKEHARRNGGRLIADDVEIFSKTTKQSTTGPRGKDRMISVDPNIVRDIKEQKGYILAKEPLTDEEVAAIRDIRTLPKERRWRLLVYWQNKLARAARDHLDTLVEKYQVACIRAEKAADFCRADVLRKSLIVGATTTGAAKRRELLAKIGPKVLIVEEAAEVLEAHLLASIVPSIQHAIFIGDHQQLRPSTAVHALAKTANLEVSLFERLVKNGYPFHTLGLQHRMLTPLTKYVVKPFFYNKLEDAPSVHAYPKVKGMVSNLFFWSHEVPEDSVIESMSKKNIVEAEMCINLANYILLQQQYTAKEITIIGMYGAQVAEIRRQLQNNGGPVRDVAAETVDSFQGKENRIMILSLVRSKSGGVGFLAIANRITVALTRAQHGMYVVGNFKDIAYFSSLWSDIVESLMSADVVDYELPVECQRHGHVQGIGTNMSFIKKTPRGGCTDVCRYTMPCGHECRRVCHPPPEHERNEIECEENCMKKCDKCGARCSKKCRDVCGTCHAVVVIELSCGHEVKCECGARALAKCKEPCKEELACGHLCQNKCSSECVTMEKCEVGVHYSHPICAHPLQLPCCRVNPLLQQPIPPCYEPCPETLVCGHKCPKQCGEKCPTICEKTVRFTGACGHQLEKKCSDDPKHVKCMMLVDSVMPNCSHRIRIECFQSRNQNECRSVCKQPTSCGHECSLGCGECFKRASVHECGARCAKVLLCGHKCESKCGKPCRCLAQCRNRCAHQRCGSLASTTSGGKMYFGRACSEACVLCTASCDNHCEHRSCSKKCYEVCDVAACSQPCSKLLRCKHVCLGLCGETCPELCGTCKMTAYKTVLEQYPTEDAAAAAGAGSSSTYDSIVRLLQLPECGHVFPVKFMDREVRRQLQEQGAAVLRCPRCNGIVDECRRYIKQQKRLWMEADSRRWERRLAEEDMSRAEMVMKRNEMRNTLRGGHETVQEKYKQHGVRNDHGSRVASEIYRQSEVLYTRLNEAFNRELPTGEYYYWSSLLECYKCVCGLVIGYLCEYERLKVDFSNDLQPNLRAVLDEAYERKRQRLVRIRDQFKEMCTVLVSSLEDRRVGALVPQFRMAIIRSTLYFQMERLHAAYRGQRDEKGCWMDLPQEHMVTYKRVIKSILFDSPSDHPDKKLESLVTSINTNVYDRILKCSNLYPNTFNVPLPKF